MTTVTLAAPGAYKSFSCQSGGSEATPFSAAV